jgi:transposase
MGGGSLGYITIQLARHGNCGMPIATHRLGVAQGGYQEDQTDSARLRLGTARHSGFGGDDAGPATRDWRVCHGLDLHTGRIVETVSDTHRSADFIAFLKKLDGAYPEHQKIRLVWDNPSAHISQETRSYLETTPQRFVFVFTPAHGSWLNLIEMQFSKMARTMLRGIRVASRQELIDRIHQYVDEIKMDEVVIV